MSASPGERRKHARFPRTFEVAGRHPDGVEARMVATNLSAGGLYCTSDTCFAEMTQLSVRLMLPAPRRRQPQPVDLEAVVVRNRAIRSTAGGDGFELALFFTHIDEEQRERIARYLGG